MRRFNSVNELWRDAVINCVFNGRKLQSRAGGCTELIGYGATLIDATNCVLTVPTRAMAPHYAAAELLWYLSGDSSIEMIKRYAPQYEKFANDGHARGAYGDRMYNNSGWRRKRLSNDMSQLQGVIELLRTKPNTRQAVIALWDSGDLAESIIGEWKDIPCTVALQFIVREGKVHAITFMRSNDVWLGMPYDVFCFCAIQTLIAAELGLGVGTYTHNVGSLHAYDRDMSKVHTAARDANLFDVCGIALPLATFNDIYVAQTAESTMRRKHPQMPFVAVPQVGFAADLYKACASHLSSDWTSFVPESDAFKILFNLQAANKKGS